MMPSLAEGAYSNLNFLKDNPSQPSTGAQLAKGSLIELPI